MSFDKRYKEWLDNDHYKKWLDDGAREARETAEKEKALRVKLGMPDCPRGLQEEATLDTVLGDILDELDTLREKIANIKLLVEITTIRD